MPWRDPFTALTIVHDDTSGAAYALNVQQDVQPSGSSTALFVAVRGYSRTTNTNAMVDDGHNIGVLGYVEHTQNTTIPLMVGTEGLAGNTSTGTVTTLSVVGSHVNANAGTITNLKNYDGLIGAISGTVTNAIGYDARMAATAPTITNYYGFLQSDLNDGSGSIANMAGYLFANQTNATITNKWCILNQDANARIQSLARIEAPGVTYQTVEASSVADLSGTTLFDDDDNIPANTEGDQYLTVSITPKSASNILQIDVQMVYSVTAADYVITALFQDSTASALATWPDYIFTDFHQTKTYSFRMTAGTTSSTTFKIRAGRQAAGTLYVNSRSGSGKFGDTAQSFIRVTEIGV